MHADETRHVWRYDVGGYAWDNGELGTDLWLWMSFLRTGRADVFHMASALTRHLSEVDSHHTGTFAGLGSRHHVTHWGDGAKEARVASATLRRPFFYLTTDELIGDLIDTTLLADASIVTWEPLRKVPEAPPFTTPTRVRIGPDWTTLAGNWFTRWERTLEDKWLEKLKTGMVRRSLSLLPGRHLSHFNSVARPRRVPLRPVHRLRCSGGFRQRDWTYDRHRRRGHQLVRSLHRVATCSDALNSYHLSMVNYNLVH